ncbi:MAG: methylaspartate mutase accessory protein GlmL [Treponema sp.]|nr:methylaspartate mutase accessory protein GlmL [Treponema sp.]
MTALLVDFGSTFTKLTAADLKAGKLIGSAAAYTTVETDVGEGLATALTELKAQTGIGAFDTRLACSSAAGGLRMVVCGFVPTLTAEAAKIASLGAGAKVARVYSYRLTDEDVDEIAAISPDILLLTGGTDYGDRRNILHNAEMLAGCAADFPIIIAGNRVCAEECERLLSGREVYRCDNVMPEPRKLNIEPTQERVRELFLRRIVQAKGLTREAELLDGIVLPTPAAVLSAMELLAKGTDTQPGLGELIAVDLGGATTDVYSMASGAPSSGGTVVLGLPEPWAKRTVEGDIGMRYSAAGVIEAVGAERLAELSGLDEAAIPALVEGLGAADLPDTPERAALDFALASAAVRTAISRHAGTVSEAWTPHGNVRFQYGKDLTGVRTLIATGGALVHSPDAAKIAAHALQIPIIRMLHNLADSQSLCPKVAQVRIDRRYILSAMGLLAAEHPDVALGIMKNELK